MDFDDEGGGDSGEQTSLDDVSMRTEPPWTELTKIRVVFKSSSYFFMNSLSNSSASLR